jgi:dipeptidyl aminopeptidase/acylaminoacyl peptidase
MDFIVHLVSNGPILTSERFERFDDSENLHDRHSSELQMPQRPAQISRIWPLFSVILLVSGPISAETQPQLTPEWQIDDLISSETAGDLTISAEGKKAAWVQSGVMMVDDEEKRVGQIWLYRNGDEEARQITHGEDSSFNLAFSPDGQHLAFLSERPIPGSENEDAGPQLWVLPLEGGEPMPLTDSERAVEGYEWIDDETLVILRGESKSVWEKELEAQNDEGYVVDDRREPPRRLFKVGFDGKSSRLTDNADWIDQVAVAPNGKFAVVTAQQSVLFEFDSKIPPKTFRVDLESGERRELLADTRRQPRSISFSADSKSLYFVDLVNKHPIYRQAGVYRAYRFDLATNRFAEISLDWPRGLAEAERSLQAFGTDLAFLLADGVREKPVVLRQTQNGLVRRDLSGKHKSSIDEWVISKDGERVLYLSSTASRLPQVFFARLGDDRITDEKQVSSLNEHLVGKPTGKVEVISWKGANDAPIEGLLSYPLDWREGEKRPLVLDIHGGPFGNDQDSWVPAFSSANLIFRQRGAFLLQVNYHGSSGYGQDFAEAIGDGRYYDLEFTDIEKGVDFVIARGLVDPEKLATTGWSNGGILSADLITKSTRYKAASIGAADVEWFSDWANVDFGASFDNYYLGGPPWEKVEAYIEKSPFFRLDKVVTPTVIHTGMADTNVPPHQSRSLFRVLQDIGKVPARLIEYPGEPHGLRQVAHQRRRLTEDVAWLDQYLFGLATKNVVVAPDTPLGALLARQAASKVGERFGTEVGNALLPEMVKVGSLEVSRFELTRAQLQSFDPAYVVAPGTEDLPASLTSDQAKAYVAWAAKASKGLRLPTILEAQALAEAAGSDGNTLDYWMADALNPDDAKAALQQTEAAGLSLLLPVGSFFGWQTTPASPAVFDLDGSVAEWATGDKGVGVAIGPSADRPADADAKAAPGAAYIGLRLVR